MRVLRVLFWLLAALVGLVVVLLLAGFISWQLALDRDYQHTRDTAGLPLFPERHEGLVRVRASDMEFRARVEGLDQSGPVIMMLHGFPETSIMWQPLLTSARDAGMAAIAFDQRGYSPGARPSAVEDYVVPELVRDVFAVAETLGVGEFHVVGHDWGAAVAWSTAMLQDPRVLTVTALSIPHGAAFVEAIVNDPEQRRRSSYMAVFRTPVLAEYMFGTLDMGLLKAMHEVNQGAALDEYVRVLSEPGAMTAALNWYRASALGSDDADLAQGSPMIYTPALFIGGERDGAVARSGIEAQSKYMAGPFESHMRDAGHWLMGEDTEFVVETIIDFVARQTPKGTPKGTPTGQ